MSDSYSVPKRKIDVELWTSGRSSERAALFLSDRAESHAGAERPSDVLDAQRGFVAVEDASGRIVMLNTEAVWLARIAVEEEQLETSPVDDASRVPVSVELEDGTLLEADACYQLPDDRSRLQDFLNAAGRFVPFRDSEAVLLVKRSRIVRVVPR